MKKTQNGLCLSGVLLKGDTKLENNSDAVVDLVAGEYVNSALDLTPAVPASV